MRGTPITLFLKKVCKRILCRAILYLNSSLSTLDACFVESLIAARSGITRSGDQVFLNEQICNDVMKECVVKGCDLFTENRFLLQVTLDYFC